MTGGNWPLEEDTNCREDMGVDNATKATILAACKATNEAALVALGKHKGFEWHVMAGPSLKPAGQSCKLLRNACAPDATRKEQSTYDNRTLNYELPRSTSGASTVPNITEHLAAFLVRELTPLLIHYCYD